jgi:hypothetical protein
MRMSKGQWFAVVVIATFAAAYVPAVISVAMSKTPDIGALRKPDAIGGLMGFLFTVLLAIGEKNYGAISEDLVLLNNKVTALSHAKELEERLTAAKSGPYAPLFGKLTEGRIERLLTDLQSMVNEHPFYLVRRSNPVQEYIDIFVHLMNNIIQPGDEFRVITNDFIWSSDSFGGPDRRYLLANKEAAKRGVRITRVFTFESKEHDVQYLRSVLAILKDHRDTLCYPGSQVDLAVYEIESKAAYLDMLKTPSSNFALWNVSESAQVCTVVEYLYGNDGKYSISGVKFDTNPMLIKDKNAAFSYFREHAISIENYIAKLEALITKEAGRQPAAPQLLPSAQPDSASAGPAGPEPARAALLAGEAAPGRIEPPSVS